MLFMQRKLMESISRSTDICKNDSEHEFYKSGMQWLEEFIMQPHDNLGRPGDVCPFVKSSHESGSLFFSHIDVDSIRFDEYISILIMVSNVFDLLKERPGINQDLLSLVLYLGKLKESEYVNYVDVAHTVVKQVFMSNGQMIGEFRPLSNVEGAREKTFRPMQSSQPTFVVRNITDHDHLFIAKETSSKEVCLHELECYRKYIKRKSPNKKIEDIENRINLFKYKLNLMN